MTVPNSNFSFGTLPAREERFMMIRLLDTLFAGTGRRTIGPFEIAAEPEIRVLRAQWDAE